MLGVRKPPWSYFMLSLHIHTHLTPVPSPFRRGELKILKIQAKYHQQLELPSPERRGDGGEVMRRKANKKVIHLRFFNGLQPFQISIAFSLIAPANSGTLS